MKNKCLFFNLIHLNCQESFKSVAQGVPEIFEEVYLGGGAQCAPPPPLVGIGLSSFAHHKSDLGWSTFSCVHWSVVGEVAPPVPLGPG